jgi:hypothetical protein
MSQDGIRRREFIRRSAVWSEQCRYWLEKSRQPRRGQPAGDSQQGTRPLVISSSNINRTPTGEVFQGGIACCHDGRWRSSGLVATRSTRSSPESISSRMIRVTARSATADCPNEEVRRRTRCERHARPFPARRRRRQPASYQEPGQRRQNWFSSEPITCMLVGEGALRFALKHGFKKRIC